MNTPLDPSLAAFLIAHVLANQHVSFACVDKHLRLQLVGPGLEDFLETKPQTLAGAYLPDVFIEFFGAEEALHAVLRGEATEFRLSPVARDKEDGQTAYLTFQFLSLGPAASTPGLLLVGDITPSGQLEQRLIQERNELRLVRAALHQANAQLEHLNQFKSTLLSIAAHDLRSPLTAISLWLQMSLEDLKAQQPPSGQVQQLHWMLSATNRMKQLISGLLDQEQANQGKLILEPASCDLAALVRQVISLIHPNAAQRVEMDAPPEGLKLVADSDRLQQVFYNLIDNALKYTSPELPIRITLRRQGEWAVVHVSDRGSGLTPGETARLFQMYYRTDNAQRRSIAGRGLGLFIVKTLVEAHHGRVEVTSQPGQGTTFSVYLPASTDTLNGAQAANTRE